MARPIDYSKWKDIEISDDEDDTHPNIDTPSLFRWRHQARVQRMEEFEEKRKQAEDERRSKHKYKEELESKLKEAAASNDSSSMDMLKKSLMEAERAEAMVEEKLKEVAKEDKLRPWNVDTISKDGFSKTIVNKPKPRENDDDLDDEEREKRMKDFIAKHEKEMKHFGWLSKFDDSKQYLLDHKHLACEYTANYLVIQCINLAMEEKYAAMEQVAHQTIAMQYLLELAKQLDIDPRACISSFFSKIQVADPEYKKAFYDELSAFKDRIRRRAKEKIEEQMEELRKEEEEERKQRLGPGGLDPVEVFETLPRELRECFESQNIEKLQEVIRNMPENEARHHMKRCVDAGLWKPAADDPNTNPEDGFKKKGDEDEESPEDERKDEQPVATDKKEEENIYQEAK